MAVNLSFGSNDAALPRGDKTRRIDVFRWPKICCQAKNMSPEPLKYVAGELNYFPLWNYGHRNAVGRYN